jgi:hypothetical protein
MVRPSRERRIIPILSSGTLGYDPGVPTTDVESPPNLASPDYGAQAYVPFVGGQEASIVQSATGTWVPTTTDLVATFDAAPTAGNRIVVIEFLREGASPVTPDGTGWTAHPDGYAFASAFGETYRVGMFRKVASAGESATVTASFVSPPTGRIDIFEITGTSDLDVASEISDQAGTALSVSATPTAGIDALMIAGFVHRVSDFGAASVAPDANSTELFDEYSNGGYSPLTWAAYRIITNAAGAYAVGGTASASADWGAQAMVFEADPSMVLWVPAPATIDGSDATFDYAYDTGITPIWRVTPDDTYLLASLRALIGFESSGSKTVTLQGSDDEDFTSPVTLAASTFSATGSFTGDEIALSWTPAGAYAYYQLILGAAHDVRIYEVELYGPVTSGVTDHPDLTGRSDADQHPASSVTFTPAGSVAATDVQAAIAEVDGDVTTVAGALTSHLTDTTDAHDASAVSFTPAGTIAATDVQAAIEEVAAEAGSGVALSDATPIVESGSGSAGTGTEASRDDHVHPADGGGGGGAPTDAEYLVTAADGDLSAERVVDLGAYQLLTRPAITNTEDDGFTAASLDAKWLAYTGFDATTDLTVLSSWAKFTGAGAKLQAVPVGDWTIETELMFRDSGAASYGIAGMIITSGTTRSSASEAQFAVGQLNSLVNWRVGAHKFINGAFSSSYVDFTGRGHEVTYRFLRIVKASTTYTFEVSVTGKTWHRFLQTSALGFTPTHFGLFDDTSGTLFNYFVRY